MQLKWPMLWDLFSLFPAYAGVIPSGLESAEVCWTFPRIRGGDPETDKATEEAVDFSPHTRG